MLTRKLIPADTFPEIMAEAYVIEGTRLYVLELKMFGFAYASYYLLLKSHKTLAQLSDQKLRDQLLKTPAKFGKHLEFGRELGSDPQDQLVYYLAPVPDQDLLPGS